MTLSTRQRHFTKVLGQLLIHMYEQGDEATLGDVWRSNDRLMCPHAPEKSHTYQELLAYNGRSKVSGEGPHYMRLAADILLWTGGVLVTVGEPYRPYGEWWEHQGGKWGGRFGVKPADYSERVGWDPSHFEWPL